jgi:hypothetical protein
LKIIEENRLISEWNLRHNNNAWNRIEELRIEQKLIEQKLINHNNSRNTWEIFGPRNGIIYLRVAAAINISKINHAKQTPKFSKKENIKKL